MQFIDRVGYNPSWGKSFNRMYQNKVKETKILMIKGIKMIMDTSTEK